MPATSPDHIAAKLSATAPPILCPNRLATKSDHWQRHHQLHPAVLGDDALTTEGLNRPPVPLSHIWWSLRQYVPTLPRELKELVKVRQRLTSGEMEPVAEDHSIRQRQVVRLTDAQINRLVEGYLAGNTAYELGRLFTIARQTVSEHLHRRGVPMRGRGPDDSPHPEIVRLRGEGWSLKRLGERFGVNASTVKNFLAHDR